MRRLGERDPPMAGGRSIASKPPLICPFGPPCWRDGRPIKDQGSALARVALRYLALSKPRKGLPWAAAAPTSWPKSAAQKETSGSRESPKEASGSRGTSRRFPTVSITVLCRRTKAGCVSRTRSSPLRFSSASRWLFWSAV
jgi:hypothetical protein